MVSLTQFYCSGTSDDVSSKVNILACNSTANSLFAAFAPISAALYPTAFPNSTVCKPGKPVPIINFHGLADTIVPFGGRANNSAGDTNCTNTYTSVLTSKLRKIDPFVDALPNITIWRQGWATLNGCPNTTVSNLTSLATSNVNNSAFLWNCQSVSSWSVVHGYSVYGLQHSWPSTAGLDDGATTSNETAAFPLSQSTATFNATNSYIVPFLNSFAGNKSFDYTITPSSSGVQIKSVDARIAIGVTTFTAFCILLL